MWPLELLQQWATRSLKQMKRDPQDYDQVPVDIVANRLISIKGELPITVYYNIFCQALSRAGFITSTKTRTSTPIWPVIFQLFEKALDCGPTQLTKKQKSQLECCLKFAKKQSLNPTAPTRKEKKRLSRVAKKEAKRLSLAARKANKPPKNKAKYNNKKKRLGK